MSEPRPKPEDEPPDPEGDLTSTSDVQPDETGLTKSDGGETRETGRPGGMLGEG